MKEAFQECPRFEFCNVNDCLLSSKRYQTDSSDCEQKCTLSKNRRLKLGLKYKLVHFGLKPRELHHYKIKLDLHMKNEKKLVRNDSTGEVNHENLGN